MVATERMVDEVLETLRQASRQPEGRLDASALGHQLLTAGPGQVDWLLNELCDDRRLLSEPGVQQPLGLVLAMLVRAQGQQPADNGGPQRVELIVRLYQLLPAESPCRNRLLGWLATISSESSIARFTSLLVQCPPLDAATVPTAFAPLLRRDQWHTPLLFPELLAALAHRTVAAAVLDLANHLTRSGALAQHPACSRLAQLVSLLRQIVQQLQEIENGHLAARKTQQQLSDLIDTLVPLVVSTCDALGLIEQPSAASVLYDAMQLKHRRIQTEAAAALARMGDDRGRQHLAQLAAEPVMRLRVLAYADELGMIDQIHSQYQTDQARAESQVALWLAEPTQIGLAPSRLELLLVHELFWPGFDEPVRCYLFRYQYSFGTGQLSNIALAGPMIHAFAADLGHLQVDDILAAFAGWQALHEDIFEIPLQQARRAYGGDYQRLWKRMVETGARQLTPELFAVFFEKKVLVAAALTNGQRGFLVADGDLPWWIDAGGGDAPLTAELAFCIYKGRRLLEAFNGQILEDSEESPC